MEKNADALFILNQTGYLKIGTIWPIFIKTSFPSLPCLSQFIELLVIKYRPILFIRPKFL